MIELKLSKSEAKEANGVYPDDKGPMYPYGLTIYLDTDTLAKLGITDMPQIDAEMSLTAKVTVTGTSARKQQGGEEYKCVDLQITAMELSGESRKATADVLYG